MGKISVAILFVWFIWAPLAKANPVADLFLKLRDMPQSGSSAQWRPVASVPLYRDAFPTFHPQGLKILGKDAYLSSVEGQRHGTGHLIHYKLNLQNDKFSATPLRQMEFPAGPDSHLNHAGGMDGDASTLYVPLAGYDSEGPAQILKVDLHSFGSYRAVAHFNDHVGAVIFAPEIGQLKLFDWATGMYSLPLSMLGEGMTEIHLPKVQLDPEWEYQDCKNLDGVYALCSAKSGAIFPWGEIHLVKMSANGLQVVHRVSVAHIRGDGTVGGRRPLSYNAMDVSLLKLQGSNEPAGLRFYFVPHDDEDSHLFIYDAYVPASN